MSENNTLTITVGEVMRSQPALRTLLNLNLISGTSMFRLKRIAKQLQPVKEAFEETEQLLFTDFGSENAAGDIAINAKSRILFNAKLKEVNAETVEITGSKFKLFDLRTKPGRSDDPEKAGLDWVTSAILLDLDWLIEEQEG